MEKQSYVIKLSLKEICLRRVAVILWTRKCFLGSNHFLLIENYVSRDMKKLELPPVLEEQMTCLFELIQSEIYIFKDFHEIYLEMVDTDAHRKLIPINTDILQQLCWTNLGTVDIRKSVEKIIRHEMLDNIECFKLACLYCLEDYIQFLWEKLSEDYKMYFDREFSRNAEPRLEFCWPYILKGEETKLNHMLERSFRNTTTFNQYAFEYSASKGIKSATEYFFRKLTNDEKNASLFRTVQSAITNSDLINDIFETFSHRSDTFIYLLSLLGPEQQMEIFKENPYNVLRSFLDWPWQDLSFHIAELIWPFLSADEYARSLEMISREIKSGFKLTQLFQDLLLHGSSDFRKYFVDQECQSGVCFRSFLKVRDTETIKIIFRAVDSIHRKRLVFSRGLLKHFYISILRKKYHMMELCLREATLCKDDKEDLKKVFLTFLTEIEKERTIVHPEYEMIMPRLLNLEEEEERIQFPSLYLTETEIDARNINRKEYVWEQFLHIVDEGKAKTHCTRSLEDDDSRYASSESLLEDMIS